MPGIPITFKLLSPMAFFFFPLLIALFKTDIWPPSLSTHILRSLSWLTLDILVASPRTFRANKAKKALRGTTSPTALIPFNNVFGLIFLAAFLICEPNFLMPLPIFLKLIFPISSLNPAISPLLRFTILPVKALSLINLISALTRLLSVGSWTRLILINKFLYLFNWSWSYLIKDTLPLSRPNLFDMTLKKTPPGLTLDKSLFRLLGSLLILITGFFNCFADLETKFTVFLNIGGPLNTDICIG